MSGVFGDLNEQYNQHDQESSSYFKLDDGQKAVVAFLGRPYAKKVYWENGKNHRWVEGCGHTPSLRTTMNVAVFKMEQNGNLVLVDGKPVILGVQIVEQGKKFFRMVMKKDAKFGIENKLFEIEREGSTKDDTVYHIEADADITPDLSEKLKALTLYDLERTANSEKAVLVGEKGGASAAGGEAGDNKRLADSSAVEPMIADLRTLSEYRAEIVNEFLAKFSIQRIRELLESDVKAARSWIDSELEGMRHAASDGEEEPAKQSDPFA